MVSTDASIEAPRSEEEGRRTDRRWRLGPAALTIIPLLLLCLGAVYYLSASSFSRNGFPLDDAWIHRVYSESFALGRGFAYNPGEQEAGATSPLWVIVSAPAHWIGLATPGLAPMAVKVIGTLVAALVLLLLAAVARQLGGSQVTALLSAVLFCADPRFLFSALSGMETLLLIALWVGVIWAFLASRWTLLSLFLGLAPLARPEALLVVVITLACALFVAEARRQLFTSVMRWALLLMPSLAWCLFCKLASGRWLPTTYYMKRQLSFGLDAFSMILGGAMQAGWLSLPIGLLGLLTGIVFLATLARRRGLIAPALLVAAPIGYLLAIVATRKMDLRGYYWTRYLDPGLLVLTAAAVLGVSWVLTVWRPARKWMWRTAALGVLIFLALGAVPLARSLAASRSRLASDSRAIHLINVEAGKWIRSNTPDRAVVGVNDAGAIRYFGRRKTLDLLGLNNAEIAFRRPGPVELLRRLDWLAVFPRLLDPTIAQLFFTPRKQVTIPLAEYTVCPCPAQTLVVIYEKKR